MGVDSVVNVVSSAPNRNSYVYHLSSARLSHAAEESAINGAADSARLQRGGGAITAGETRPEEKAARG
jgi:hypothetical protein